MANVQVRLDQTVNGNEVKNVTYWQLPNNLLVTYQEFADNLRAKYSAILAPELSDDWSLDHLTLREMDGAGAFTFVQTFSAGPLVGVSNGALLPTQLSALLSTVYVGSRPNRGRIYLAGMQEGANDQDGTWTVGALAVFQTFADSLVAGVSTAAGVATLRIARPNFIANTWTLNNPVNAIIARDNPATQRRRRAGQGS